MDSLKEINKYLTLSRNKFEILSNSNLISFKTGIFIKDIEQALEESLRFTDQTNEMQEIEAQMLELASKEGFRNITKIFDIILIRKI